ncbi:MAG: peptide deformylase [Rhodospirillales bacterium]|nr:peptide deformylase [Rhodospirillales bacterium]
MALMPIIIAPDPRLKIKTKPVDHVDDAVRALMDDMLETMYAANGIGLAAPQVGDTRSVIVVDCARQDDGPAPIQMANPQIIAVSSDDNAHEEGCLSLPEHYADVVRPESITLRYLDENNKVLEMDADGILATCIQHEMDHLEGILFVDHISALKRNMILRKLKKVKKQATED